MWSGVSIEKDEGPGGLIVILFVLSDWNSIPAPPSWWCHSDINWNLDTASSTVRITLNLHHMTSHRYKWEQLLTTKTGWQCVVWTADCHSGCSRPVLGRCQPSPSGVRGVTIITRSLSGPVRPTNSLCWAQAINLDIHISVPDKIQTKIYGSPLEEYFR